MLQLCVTGGGFRGTHPAHVLIYSDPWHIAQGNQCLEQALGLCYGYGEMRMTETAGLSAMKLHVGVFLTCIALFQIFLYF